MFGTANIIIIESSKSSDDGKHKKNKLNLDIQEVSSEIISEFVNSNEKESPANSDDTVYENFSENFQDNVTSPQPQKINANVKNKLKAFEAMLDESRKIDAKTVANNVKKNVTIESLRPGISQQYVPKNYDSAKTSQDTRLISSNENSDNEKSNTKKIVDTIGYYEIYNSKIKVNKLPLLKNKRREKQMILSEASEKELITESSSNKMAENSEETKLNISENSQATENTYSYLENLKHFEVNDKLSIDPIVNKNKVNQVDKTRFLVKNVENRINENQDSQNIGKDIELDVGINKPKDFDLFKSDLKKKLAAGVTPLNSNITSSNKETNYNKDDDAKLNHSNKIDRQSDSEKIFLENWAGVLDLVKQEVNKKDENSQNGNYSNAVDQNVDGEIDSKENLMEMNKLKNQSEKGDNLPNLNYSYKIGQKSDIELDFQKGWIEVNDVRVDEKNIEEKN